MDLGCGDGQLIRFLYDRNSSVHFSGLTTPGSSIQINSFGFEIKEGDMHYLPWENEFFDTVTARHVLEHSISPLISLQEINRVLVPGGYLYMVVPDPNSEWIAFWQDHYSVLTYNNWCKLIRDSGFLIESFTESTWLASHSMQNEIEYRFKLKKIGTSLIPLDAKSPLKAESMGNPGHEFQGSSNFKLVAVLHNLMLFNQLEEMLSPYKDFCLIIIPSLKEEGWREMTITTYDFLISKDWDVRYSSELENVVQCDIALFPYKYPVDIPVHSRWSGRYLYGLAKDEWNLSIENNIYFDFVFTYGPIEDSFISSLTKTIPIGNMQIFGQKDKSSTNDKKKTVLYLPTFGELSSIPQSRLFLAELAREFDLIIKLHHGISFLDPETVKELRKSNYKLFDHETPLSDLLNDADVVLTDVSGSMHQAIAAEVPVVVLEVQMNRNTDLVQKHLQEKGFITSTFRHEELGQLLKTALKQDKNQLKEASRLIYWATGAQAIENAQNFLSELLEAKNENLIYELKSRRRVKNQVVNSFNESLSAKKVSEKLSKAYLNQNMKILSDYNSIKSDLEVKIAELESTKVSLEDSRRKTLEIENVCATQTVDIEKMKVELEHYQLNSKKMALEINSLRDSLDRLNQVIKVYESSKLLRLVNILKRIFSIR